MTRRISINLPWDPRDATALLAQARSADDRGVDTIWVHEGFGHDAFSGLALLAWETERVRLGTSVVNVYSRTPGALAQHFATLDQLSGGRIVAGLGTSGQGVVERFHGLPYQPSIGRLREVLALLRAYWRHERLTYDGHWFQIERAIEFGVDPVQPELPIHLATLHPGSVALTAEQADGWLPAWIPFDRLGDAVTELRAQAVTAGRPAAAVEVRGPGTITVVSGEADERALRASRRQQLAFFVARNGDFYYRQFLRHGLADEAQAIRRAWASGGARAGTAAVFPGLEDRFDFAGDLDACIARIEQQAELGVDLHQVSVIRQSGAQWAETIGSLVGDR